jgi:dTDP-4-dehydrorhamnose reductase
MKLLLLGSEGQLGSCLSEQFHNSDFEVVYSSRDTIDISDFELTKKKITEASPNVLINATAYTEVDKAEEDKQRADLINHLAVANIANICCEIDCWFFHISTDYVFDGTSTRPYREDDKTNPQGVYGHTKLKGELAVQSSGCKHIIVRTAWIFSEYGKNFFKTMLRLGAEKRQLKVVRDQIGCPTYAQDIARAIICIITHLDEKTHSGTYNFCGDECCSWYEFSKEIFHQAREANFNVPDTVSSISTLEYPTPAKRPAYSVLDTNKIHDHFGINPSDWRAGIKKILTSS